MNRIKAIFAKADNAADFARLYLEHLARLIGDLDHDSLASVIDALIEARGKGKTIYIMGNGGSAATASHFASDLSIGTQAGEQPFKAFSLSANVSAISAISNDYGYQDVFFKQLENRVNEGDVVIAISASGESANVLKAMSYAKEMNCVTIAFVGFNGGPLLQLADTSVHVASANGEYGPVEDLHLIFGHLISNYLMLHCKHEREGH